MNAHLTPSLPQKKQDKDRKLESIQSSRTQNSATFKIRGSNLSSGEIIFILKIDKFYQRMFLKLLLEES